MMRALLPLLMSLTTPILAAEPAPRSLDPRLKIELFAEHPQIVTPTGIDVDHRGRVWAIESNTHFRPEDYEGHPSDRVLVMSDTDGDRRADQVVVFADGLTHAMSIAVRPVWLSSSSPPSEGGGQGGKPRALENTPVPSLQTTDVFLATRDAVWLMHDDDGDLRADRKERLVQLDTPGDYPHNGLGGVAFDGLGWMYFGFGENLGAEYKIIGSDGTTLSGGGEGGNLYRCRPDGTQLSRWATGFWNPHASCVDAFGRLFTVDNDPDSRPPCRLLHVIPGGDYGYRFRNGRKGLHPFTSWNGEIPGTLPMVAGTGEAPSGIVAYESDGLPDDYLGTLLVTSWGDHRIDRFRLEPKGASFTSRAEPIIVGGQDFRPVGLALAPDGSLYCTDWVLRDYELHGKGHIWRISAVEEPQREILDIATITTEQQIDRLKAMLSSRQLDVRRTAARALSTTAEGRDVLLRTFHGADRRAADARNESQPGREQFEALWAIAEVPPEIHQFSSLDNEEASRRLAERANDLDAETLRLVGTPQFPPKPVQEYFTARIADMALAHQVRKSRLRETHGNKKDTPRDGLKDPEPSPFDPGRGTEHPELARRERFLLSVVPLVPFRRALRLAEDTDPFLMAAIVERGKQDTVSEAELQVELFGWSTASGAFHPGPILASLLTARQKYPESRDVVRFALVRARRVAVRWIAEESLADMRPDLHRVLDGGAGDEETLRATLAALSVLDGVPPAEFEKRPPAEYILPIVGDSKRSSRLRMIALRLLPPDTKEIDASLMRGLLKADDPLLNLEAIRTLQFVNADWAADLLREIATNDKPRSPNRWNDAASAQFWADIVRAEAVAALAPRRDEPSRRLLRELMASSQVPPVIRTEAIRALRGTAADDPEVRGALLAQGRKLQRMGAVTPEVREKADQLALALDGLDVELPWGITNYRSKRPQSSEQWLESLSDSSDEEFEELDRRRFAGRRAFFHPSGAGCSKCHTVHGRGGNVGPDLSNVGRAMGRRKLAESILEPNKEVSPQFTTWTFLMKSGQVHTGLSVGEGPGDVIQVGIADGSVLEIKRDEIEERLAQKASIMPEKLYERLTPGEFRDLLAFLETLK